MKYYLATSLLLVLNACGSAKQPAAGATSESQEQGRGLANAWLPLHPGSVWLYEGSTDGELLREIITAHAPEYLPGVGYCTPLWQTRYVADVLVEQTVEWYLVDEDSTVWRAGERSWELQDHRLELTADSWLAGEQGMGLLLYLPADARRGDQFSVELPTGIETFAIVDDQAQVVVPAGSFDECLEVHENAGSSDQDIILYGPSAGIVEERWRTGGKVLVEYHRPND